MLTYIFPDFEFYPGVVVAVREIIGQDHCVLFSVDFISEILQSNLEEAAFFHVCFLFSLRRPAFYKSQQ